MKLSEIEKRIPQTLTNSKDVIQKGLEYARRSSRARSTRGQENEVWALYKKIHPGCPWLVFLGTQIHSFTKVSHPCWKYICSRAIVHLRQTRLVQANYMFQSTCQNEKKSTKGQPQDTRDGCSQADVSVGFQRPYFCPSMRHLQSVFMQSFISLGKTFFLLIPRIFINFYFPDSGVYFEWFGFLFLMA